jgi:hypothetical protein
MAGMPNVGQSQCSTRSISISRYHELARTLDMSPCSVEQTGVPKPIYLMRLSLIASITESFTVSMFCHPMVAAALLVSTLLSIAYADFTAKERSRSALPGPDRQHKCRDCCQRCGIHIRQKECPMIS